MSFNKQKSYRILFTFFLLTIVLCAGSVGIFAQDDDEVIVDGNPSLRQSEIDRSINVLEKIFGYTFAGDEWVSLRYYAIHDGQNDKKGVISGIKIIASFDGRIQQASDEKIAQVREALVDDLKKSNDSEVYEFLLEIYNRQVRQNQFCFDSFRKSKRKQSSGRK